MVKILKDQIVITIPTASPVESLQDLQTGIIDLIQNLLSQGREGKDLAIDQDTAHGGFQLLQLLRGTLTMEHPQGKQETA